VIDYLKHAIELARLHFVYSHEAGFIAQRPVSGSSLEINAIT